MLFKKSADLNPYIQSSEINFSGVKKLIEEIEISRIYNLIGSEYTVLNAAYISVADESLLTGLQQTLLDKCRKVIGPYLCYQYAPLADASLSDSGVRRMETATHKSAYQYQLTAYRDAMLTLGETASENLLGYMEENILSFPLWAASNEYKKYSASFIKSAKEFNELLPSASPYSLYWSARSRILETEENEIRSFLGSALYEALKTGPLNLMQQQLIVKLKPAIARLALASTLPFVNASISRNGISVISQTPKSASDDVSSRSNADRNTIETLRTNLVESARQWLNNADVFMRNNILEFPTYIKNITPTIVTQLENSATFGLI